MTTSDPSQIDDSLSAADVYAGLDEPVRALVQTNATLFKGHWDDLAEDIRRRRAGRPYLFAIDLDLDEPLAWISRLKAYESARGERLADVIPA
jgi:hypothetical protein